MLAVAREPAGLLGPFDELLRPRTDVEARAPRRLGVAPVNRQHQAAGSHSVGRVLEQGDRLVAVQQIEHQRRVHPRHAKAVAHHVAQFANDFSRWQLGRALAASARSSPDRCRTCTASRESRGRSESKTSRTRSPAPPRRPANCRCPAVRAPAGRRTTSPNRLHPACHCRGAS